MNTVRQLAVALIWLVPGAAAQFDGYTWTFLERAPCAQVTSDALTLNACYRGCPWTAPGATMLVPATGTYTLDADWRVDHIGGAQLSILKTGGATGGSVFLTNIVTPWCRPLPCSGAFPDIAFYATAGERVNFRVFQSSGLGLECFAFVTGQEPDGFDQIRVTFTDLEFQAVQLPPELEGTVEGSSFAFIESQPRLRGRFFEAPLEVRIDGAPVPVSFSPTRLFVDAPPLTPGRHELVVVTAAGATALPGGLPARPVLDARQLGTSNRIELTLDAHDPGGSYVVLAGLGRLQRPLAIGAGTYHGLLIDTAGPWATVTAGDYGSEKQIRLLVDVPGLASLSGNTLFFQALSTTGLVPITPFERSFTNLARVEVP